MQARKENCTTILLSIKPDSHDMKRWQRYCAYGLMAFFVFHTVRDILQDMGIHTLISDSFVKHDRSRTPFWYWQVFNTYVIEGTEILLTGIVLHRKKFGNVGYAAIIVAGSFVTVWLFYWFFL